MVMTITLYRDELIPLGFATEEDCKRDSLIDVQVSEFRLRKWFDMKLKSKFPKGFDDWYKNEADASHMIGFMDWAWND